MEVLGLEYEDLLKISDNFNPVRRVSVEDAGAGIRQYEENGIPIIIQGFHTHKNWPTTMFSPNWLSNNGPQEIQVRNVHNRTDSRIPLEEFLRKSRSSSIIPVPEETERLYGKDVECPVAWHEWLHKEEVIPPTLLPDSSENFMQNLPKELQVETLMCYLGIGGTFTPCHKDLCASSGQNLMCYTENSGSSIWIMTCSSDAPLVSKYFQSINRELDHENHVISMKELARAPFPVFIAQQKLGDLVLVPRRSCHQVINKGGLTIKTSWSRMTLKGLETAYYHELPLYRRVCRPEIYRVKLTIYYSLLKAIEASEKYLRSESAQKPGPSRHYRLEALLPLFEDIITEERSADHHILSCLSSATTDAHAKNTQQTKSNLEGQLRCDFCHGDIFQGFFECRECVEGDGTLDDAFGEGFAICPGCFVEGRTCRCINMQPMQCRPFSELLRVQSRARDVLARCKKQKTIDGDREAHMVGAFYAACLLRKRILEERVQRTCWFTRPSHGIAGYSGVNCRPCRRTTCYEHILQKQSMHVIDVLTLVDRDSDHDLLHAEHKASAQRYETGHNAYLQALRNGTKPDFQHQRVYMALQYRACKPANQRFATIGWYDNKTDSDVDLPMPVQAKGLRISEGDKGATSGQRKRKREVLDYVALSDTSSNTKKHKNIKSIRPEFQENNTYTPSPECHSSRARSGRSMKQVAMAPFSQSVATPPARPRPKLALSPRCVIPSITRCLSESSLSPLTPSTIGPGELAGASNTFMVANHKAIDISLSVCTTSVPRRPSDASECICLQCSSDGKRERMDQKTEIQEHKQKIQEQAAIIREKETEIQHWKEKLAEKEKEVYTIQKTASDATSFGCHLFSRFLELPKECVSQFVESFATATPHMGATSEPGTTAQHLGFRSNNSTIQDQLTKFLELYRVQREGTGIKGTVASSEESVENITVTGLKLVDNIPASVDDHNGGNPIQVTATMVEVAHPSSAKDESSHITKKAPTTRAKSKRPR